MQLQQLLKKYVGVDSIIKLGDIPIDSVVEDSVAAFQPIVSYAPNSPAAKAIGDIADNLLDIIKQDEERAAL